MTDFALPPRDSAPTVSDRAFARLAQISPAAGGKALRVAVEGGGCSGFHYDLQLVDTGEDDDLVIERDGQRVLIDAVSLPYLANAVIDYSAELIGARFVIQNPNATSSCGCGTSFSV
jgi:iron-sulfur cluster assembly accessory protein